MLADAKHILKRSEGGVNQKMDVRGGLAAQRLMWFWSGFVERGFP